MKTELKTLYPYLRQKGEDFTDIDDDIPVAVIISTEDVNERSEALTYTLCQICNSNKKSRAI